MYGTGGASPASGARRPGPMKPAAFRRVLAGEGLRVHRRASVLLLAGLLTLALWALIFLGWTTINAWLAV